MFASISGWRLAGGTCARHRPVICPADPCFPFSTCGKTAIAAPLEILIDHLRSKNILLVLDNCEHLIEACAQISETLLHACPNLHILASSREALGIDGEATYRVPSLNTLDPADLACSGSIGERGFHSALHRTRRNCQTGLYG